MIQPLFSCKGSALGLEGLGLGVGGEWGGGGVEARQEGERERITEHAAPRRAVGAPLTAGRHRLSGRTSTLPLHALQQSLLWASEQPNNCSQHSAIHQKLPESPQACLCLCPSVVAWGKILLIYIHSLFKGCHCSFREVKHD